MYSTRSGQCFQSFLLKLSPFFMIALGCRFQVHARRGIGVEISRAISGQPVADLNVTETLAVESFHLVLSPYLSRYVLRHHTALLVGKYPCFRQEKTSWIRLSNGGDITYGENAGMACFQRLEVSRNPTSLIG